MKNRPHIEELSPKTINNYRQNTPELVIQDAMKYLGLDEDQCETLRLILLSRGINKWLKARRDIIKLKAEIKREIKGLLTDYQKGNPAHKASIKLLNLFRERLRKICHQPRWVIWPRKKRARKAEPYIMVAGKRS